MVIERSISQETPYFASHGQDPDGPEAPPWPSGSQPAAKDPPACDDTEAKVGSVEEEREQEDEQEGGAQSSRKRRRKEGDVDDGDGEEEVEEDDAGGARRMSRGKCARMATAKFKSKSMAKAAIDDAQVEGEGRGLSGIIFCRTLA